MHGQQQLEMTTTVYEIYEKHGGCQNHLSKTFNKCFKTVVPTAVEPGGRGCHLV